MSYDISINIQPSNQGASGSQSTIPEQNSNVSNGFLPNQLSSSPSGLGFSHNILRKLSRIPGLGPLPGNSSDAVSQVVSDKNLSTLATLLGKADLVNAVKTQEAKGPITIYAPTNKAFANLPPAITSKLLDPKNKTILQKILEYHVSPKAQRLPSLGTSVVPNLESPKTGYRVFGIGLGSEIVNGKQVVQDGRALKEQNGSVVIPIDQVLIPPDVDLNSLG